MVVKDHREDGALGGSISVHAVFEEIIFSLFLQTDLSVTGDLTGLAY